MPTAFTLRKLAPKETPGKKKEKEKKDDEPPALDLTKFSTTDTPKKTRIRMRGNIVEVYQVKVAHRDASVNEANAYIDATMKKLFAKNPLIPNKSEKIYQVTYKLSDGRYYSSQQIKNADSSFYPDLKDEQYGIDHSEDLVEHINIMVIESMKNPLAQTQI